MPKRILIVLLGAIGDVTRALPLLCRLRRGLPRTELLWAVEPAAAPLLDHHPALTGAIVFDRPGGLPAFVRFLRAVRALRAEWTLDLQRHLKSGLVTLGSGAGRRIGFHRANSREGNFLFQTELLAPMPHFSSKLEQFGQFAAHLGIPETPVEFGLRLLPDEAASVDRLLAGVQEPFAALFVGSTAESRLWFPDRTARVIEALRDRGLSAVLVGGPGEEKYAGPILAETQAPVVSLVGCTKLRHLIGVFTRARVAVGPDCGPMHIAAAVGTPVVSLWGATSAARSAPYGSAELVVEGSAPCSPCYKKRCPIGRVCMDAIAPGTVIAQVERALARPPR